MKTLMGKKVFITGAASGIGRSTAISMGALGSRLFLTDIDRNGLKKTVDMITDAGGEVCECKDFDISNYQEFRTFAEAIHVKYGPLDVVMNIAGIALYALIEDMNHDHWERVININLKGPIYAVELFVTEMIRKGVKGHLLTVSSAAGLLGEPWHAAYCAAKAGCVGFSEVLRYDLRQHGIGVTVVCPGAVDTPLQRTVEFPGVSKKVREGNYMQGLMKKFANHAVSPEKVAKLIIKAIKKNKFLVITSFDIKLAYFLKRKLFFLYHGIMIITSRILNKIKTEPGT
jgi:NAD(P)-dependent dehydrogenase (short-subunit alcohol dehydrogenase family)